MIRFIRKTYQINRKTHISEVDGGNGCECSSKRMASCNDSETGIGLIQLLDCIHHLGSNIGPRLKETLMSSAAWAKIGIYLADTQKANDIPKRLGSSKGNNNEIINLVECNKATGSK